MAHRLFQGPTKINPKPLRSRAIHLQIFIQRNKELQSEKFKLKNNELYIVIKTQNTIYNIYYLI